MGHMDYERTRGNGVQGYGAHTWAMGHMGNVAQGYGAQEVWVTGGMGHMGNGVHKQWRHRGNLVQGV